MSHVAYYGEEKNDKMSSLFLLKTNLMSFFYHNAPYSWLIEIPFWLDIYIR